MPGGLTAVNLSLASNHILQPPHAKGGQPPIPFLKPERSKPIRSGLPVAKEKGCAASAASRGPAITNVESQDRDEDAAALHFVGTDCRAGHANLMGQFGRPRAGKFGNGDLGPVWSIEKGCEFRVLPFTGIQRQSFNHQVARARTADIVKAKPEAKQGVALRQHHVRDLDVQLDGGAKASADHGAGRKVGEGRWPRRAKPAADQAGRQVGRSGRRPRGRRCRSQASGHEPARKRRLFGWRGRGRFARLCRSTRLRGGRWRARRRCPIKVVPSQGRLVPAAPLSQDKGKGDPDQGCNDQPRPPA